MDNNNFTLKATLKATKILVSKQFYSKRLYDDWFKDKGLRKKKVKRKFLKDKRENFKSKSLTSFGGICRSKLHDESRLIQGVLMITKMMTKSSKVKITS